MSTSSDRVAVCVKESRREEEGGRREEGGGRREEGGGGGGRREEKGSEEAKRARFKISCSWCTVFPPKFMAYHAGGNISWQFKHIPSNLASSQVPPKKLAKSDLIPMQAPPQKS